MYEVIAPDPAEQYKKTPMAEWVREKVETVGLGGTSATYVTARRIAIREVGEMPKVLNVHEWLEGLLSDTAEALYVLSKAVNVKPTKPVNPTVPRIYTLKALLKSYKGVVESGDDERLLEQELRDWAARQGRWGLGCPAGCGRFWEFKPTSDLEGFEPVDPAAKEGVDEKGNPTNGYLNWSPQPDGSVKFRCDRCGAEITLRRMVAR